MSTINLPKSKRDLHRMYIDEVDNHDMKEALLENERYLMLFGVWTSYKHVVNIIQPEMNSIKQEFFPGDPDIPIVFHRKDITRFRGPFSILFSDKDKTKAIW
jgi:hypothetical protein